MKGIILILCLSFSSTYSYKIDSSGTGVPIPIGTPKAVGTSGYEEKAFFADGKEYGQFGREVEVGVAAFEKQGAVGGVSGKVGTIGAGAHATMEHGIRASAKAGLVEVSGSYDGSLGSGTYGSKVLTVGARAHMNRDQGIGAGVKATVAEVSGSYGILGAKAGLSFDTGVAIGRNVEAKILGTGFKVGVSGVELCLWGSCLWVG